MESVVSTSKKELMVFDNILETIGNTPLVKLNRITKNIPAKVYAKVEFFNPGNSIKDRIGLQLILDAEEKGLIKPGGTIIEGTSGNTGMGLALAAIIRGYKCIFTTTDKQSKEKVDMLRAAGAEVIVCPTNVPAEDPRSYYSVSKRLSEEIPNSYYPNQYDNLSNRKAHYLTTGPEIWRQTEGKITHFVAGVGTGGTISGVAKYLKEQNPNIKIIGVDTYGSVFKKYHETGIFDEKEIYPYLTEGIGEDILPANVDFELIDEFVKVTDKDAYLTTRMLAREEGILAGNSCGAAAAGILQIADRLTKDDFVVVVLPDHASRYISKVFNDDWMRDQGFISTEPKTALDIIGSNPTSVIAIKENQSVADAVEMMREYKIDQILVTNDQNQFIGSLTETKLYNEIANNNLDKDDYVKNYMDKPFPIVEEETSINEITTLINKDNPAVLVNTKSGNYSIITRYDLIQVFGNED